MQNDAKKLNVQPPLTPVTGSVTGDAISYHCKIFKGNFK